MILKPVNDTESPKMNNVLKIQLKKNKKKNKVLWFTKHKLPSELLLLNGKVLSLNIHTLTF